MDGCLVEKYTKIFEQMNRANMRGYLAPHKPILLLSIMTLMEQGLIRENKIVLNKQLEDTFKWKWNSLVDNGQRQDKVEIFEGLEIEVGGHYPFKCNIANPYFHLSNEPFWHLVPSEDWIERKEYTSPQIKKCFLYAELDPELFELMMEEVSRKALQNFLYGMI